MPLFHTDHESPESSRIDLIMLGFVENCKFFNPFMMLYDSVMKRVRNSYRYLWTESPQHCDKFTTMCNTGNLFGNTAINLRISHKLVKSTLNAYMNGARIN